MPRPLGVFTLALALAACTADDASRRTLETAGFSSVEIDGRAWLACGRGDLLATAFHAVSPGGEHVAGAVCCGVLTACTVRVQ
jgi:hypothetical protein